MMVASHLESLLAEVVEEIRTPNTEAIALGGSYARGTATRYSDIDIAHFVYHLSATRQKFHAFRAGVLLTVGQKSLAQERAHLTQPEQAIVLIPAYCELRPLYDPHGALAHFIADAQAFSWEPLQSAADTYASAMLMLTTEAPFKIASALDA